jgi:hypothetical protein
MMQELWKDEIAVEAIKDIGNAMLPDTTEQ